MMTLCKTCGTAYDAAPQICPICEDERQYVPHSGQAWTDFATVTSTHSNKWQQRPLETARFIQVAFVSPSNNDDDVG